MLRRMPSALAIVLLLAFGCTVEPSPPDATVRGDGGSSSDAGGAADASPPTDACPGACATAGPFCDGRDEVLCEPGAGGCLAESARETCRRECADGRCCGFDGEPCCSDGSCAGDHECRDGTCVSLCPDTVCAGLPTDTYLCDGDTQLRCYRAHGDPCPSEDRDACGEGGCSPETGTCNGCDPSGPCFEQPEGRWTCLGISGGRPLAGRCSVVDGCSTIVEEESCARTCAFGDGCCGTLGDTCCGARVPSCDDGLSCIDDVCTAP